MTAREEPEIDDPSEENAQRLVMLAHTRLFLLPERSDGTKLATIASFGHVDVRLAEMQVPANTPAIPTLWVELYDRASDRVIDSAGCGDLRDAVAATEAFVAEAERLNACR